MKANELVTTLFIKPIDGDWFKTIISSLQLIIREELDKDKEGMNLKNIYLSCT